MQAEKRKLTERLERVAKQADGDNPSHRPWSHAFLVQVLTEVLQLYKDRIDRLTSKLSSRSVNYSWGNKETVRLFGRDAYNISAPIVKLSEDEFKALKHQQSSNAVEANADRVQIDGAAYQQAVPTLALSEDPIDWCAALSLATGRRPVEIAATGSFALIPGATSEVMFDGQAKKRDKKGSAYPIPVLVASPKEVVELLAGVRRRITTGSPTARAALVSKGVTRSFARCDPRLRIGEGKMTAETIRGAYAGIAWRLRAASQQVPEAVYIGRILGHEPFDNATAVGHYQRAIVVGWPGAPVPELFLSPEQFAARESKESKEEKRGSGPGPAP
jgi:hypothetical protein